MDIDEMLEKPVEETNGDRPVIKKYFLCGSWKYLKIDSGEEI